MDTTIKVSEILSIVGSTRSISILQEKINEIRKVRKIDTIDFTGCTLLSKGEEEIYLLLVQNNLKPIGIDFKAMQRIEMAKVRLSQKTYDSFDEFSAGFSNDYKKNQIVVIHDTVNNEERLSVIVKATAQYLTIRAYYRGKLVKGHRKKDFNDSSLFHITSVAMLDIYEKTLAIKTLSSSEKEYLADIFDSESLRGYRV